MMDQWIRASKYSLAHGSGDWKIAKYLSQPYYTLFDLRGRYAEAVAFGDDLEWLKSIAEEKSKCIGLL